MLASPFATRAGQSGTQREGVMLAVWKDPNRASSSWIYDVYDEDVYRNYTMTAPGDPLRLLSTEQERVAAWLCGPQANRRTPRNALWQGEPPPNHCPGPPRSRRSGSGGSPQNRTSGSNSNHNNNNNKINNALIIQTHL